MTTYLDLPLYGASRFWGNAVDTAASLPTTGQVDGEVLLVMDENALYRWDESTTAWVKIMDGLADVSGPATSTDNALALFNGASGKVIKAAAAITGSRALASDASGVPVASATTAVELGHLSGVTSGVQAQLDGKEPVFTVLPVSKGGTNSGTALANNRVMASSGGSIVEAAAITASRALVSDANGIPTHAAVTATELGHVAGVTSAIQTQLDAKVAGPASATADTLPRYDGTTGKLVKTTGVTVDDDDNVAGVARLNAETAKVGGTGAAATSAVLELSGTTGALLLTRLTTTQRDALTAVEGMVIFNTTVSRFQGYFDGAWANLHGWGD